MSGKLKAPWWAKGFMLKENNFRMKIFLCRLSLTLREVDGEEEVDGEVEAARTDEDMSLVGLEDADDPAYRRTATACAWRRPSRSGRRTSAAWPRWPSPSAPCQSKTDGDRAP